MLYRACTALPCEAHDRLRNAAAGLGKKFGDLCYVAIVAYLEQLEKENGGPFPMREMVRSPQSTIHIDKPDPGAPKPEVFGSRKVKRFAHEPAQVRPVVCMSIPNEK